METKQPIEPSNAFTRLLADFRNGASQAELSTKLQELVQAVRDTGKKGRLKLTLTVRPAASGNQALIIEDDIAIDAPRHARNGAIYFATQDNLLQRDNPDQMKLSLREVAAPAPVEARELPEPPPLAVMAAG